MSSRATNPHYINIGAECCESKRTNDVHAESQQEVVNIDCSIRLCLLKNVHKLEASLDDVPRSIPAAPRPLVVDWSLQPAVTGLIMQSQQVLTLKWSQ